MWNIIRESIFLKTGTVSIQPVRFRNVINTRKPRPKSYYHNRLRQPAEPILPPKTFDGKFPIYYKCRKYLLPVLRDLEKEENPYERILANEIKDHLLESKMLLLLHRNPLTGESFYGSIVKFKKEGMALMRNSRQTVTMAVEGTKFTSILQLFQKNTNTILVSSPEVKLDVAYKLLKKMPYYILLGGIVEDRFLRRSQLDEYSELSSIDQVRAQLVSTLNAGASQLVQNLTSHQMTTVSHLNQYIELKTPKIEATESRVDDQSDPPKEDVKE